MVAIQSLKGAQGTHVNESALGIIFPQKATVVRQQQHRLAIYVQLPGLSCFSSRGDYSPAISLLTRASLLT